MKRKTLTLVCLCLAVVSCKVEDFKAASSYQRVEFNVPDIPFYPDDEPDTKSGINLNTSPLSFMWEVNDTVGIFPNQGSQVFLSMAKGVGTNSASFDGGGWALKESSSYYSYFPLVGRFYLDPRFVPVSFNGQKQSNASNPIKSARFYLASKGDSNDDGDLTFNYNILNVILNVNCSLPAGVYTNLTLSVESNLFTTEGYFNLYAQTPAIVSTKKSSSISLALDNLSLSADGTLPLYIMLAPVNLNGVTITVTVTESTGRKYVCTKVPSREYLAGKRYGLNCTSFTEYQAEYPDGVDSSDVDLGDDEEVITIK